MPLYFFDIDGEARAESPVECKDLAHAKCQAVEIVGQILCDDSSAFWDKKELGMTVFNADRLTLFSLTFFATEAPVITG